MMVLVLDKAFKTNNLGEEIWVNGGSVSKSRSTSFEDSSSLLSQDVRKEKG